MPSYLSPGVYVEEVEAGTRPIEGVGTAVAAFVGLAAKGPDNEPTLVSNWTQFSETFGDFVAGLVSRPRGLRLLPERRRQLLRRADRRRTATPRATSRSEQPKAVTAAPRGELGGYRPDGEVQRRRTPSRSRSKSPTPAARTRRRTSSRSSSRVEGKPPEVCDNVTTKRGKTNVRHQGQRGIQDRHASRRSPRAAPWSKPDKGTVQLVAPEPEPEPPVTDELGADDYVGDAADRTGFSGLEAVDEVTMVARPRPDGRLRAGRHRPRDRQGGAARRSSPTAS